MNPQENLKKVAEIFKMIDSQVSKKDFESSFKVVIDFITQFKKDILEQVSSFKLNLSNSLKTIEDKYASISIDLISKVSTRVEKMDTLLKEIIIKNGKDGEDYVLTLSDKQEIANSIVLPIVKDGSPDTAEEIKVKLEKLEGDKRLDKSAIKGLDDEIKNIHKGLSNIPRGGGGRTPAGTYFVISTLNGSTKTFTIPKYKNVAAVLASSAPFILKPTTDYTLTGVTITFTSAISAVSTLASDQTVIILYTPLFS